MPNIAVIEYPEATGELKVIYDHLISTRGKLAEVHKIQSLNPESIMKHMDLYMTIMFGKSPLKRVQREMMAVVVSRANACRYCQIHHLEAVRSFWKDEEQLNLLVENYREANLGPIDRALCDYAWRLTKHPEKTNDQSLIAPLNAVGLEDRAILDATLVIAYFNFVNRIVAALGVELETDPGGYRYE